MCFVRYSERKIHAHGGTMNGLLAKHSMDYNLLFGVSLRSYLLYRWYSHKYFLDRKTDPDRNFGFGHFRQFSIRRLIPLKESQRLILVSPTRATGHLAQSVLWTSSKASMAAVGSPDAHILTYHVHDNTQMLVHSEFAPYWTLWSGTCTEHSASRRRSTLRDPQHAPLLVISHVDLEIATPGRIFSGSSVAPCQPPFANPTPAYSNTRKAIIE
ncbi:hypothetical protein GGI35DRAFT_456645 [Trichoderma velutinum]